MKNYILMLGVAGVALGSYCAYAGNSATMTVTATIAHDVSLSVTHDVNIGTITINPSVNSNNPGTDFEFEMNSSGTVTSKKTAVISVSGTTIGTFTANIANPSACDTSSSSCGGLGFDGLSNGTLDGLFTDDDSSYNECYLKIVHSTGNTFKVYPSLCGAYDLSHVKAGKHTKTITISYTAS